MSERRSDDEAAHHIPAESLRYTSEARRALATLARTDSPDRDRFLEAAGAAELALRHLLAANEPADLPTDALNPDLLRISEVLSRLREAGLLDSPVAAALDDLMGIRERVEAGSALGPDGVGLGAAAIDALDARLHELGGHPPSTPPPLVSEASAVEPPRRGRGRTGWLVGAAVVLLAMLLVRAWPRERPAADHLEQGIALFRSAAYADAAHHFVRYARANPDDVTPHLYLARIHRRMGRPELAAAALRDAVAIAPGDPAVHQELGFLLLEAGRLDEALPRFQTAVRRDPESAGGWVGLIQTLRAMGRDSAAERAMQRAPESVRRRLSGAPG